MGFPISICISPAVLAAYPGTRVAVAHVRGQVVDTKKLKKGPVNNFLSGYKQEVVRKLVEKNITNSNFQELPVCKSWNEVFASFKTGAEKRSTIVNLLDKATKEADKIASKEAKNADLGRISDLVDFYNAVSISSLTPMGTVLPSAVQGEIQLRYGNDGEEFRPLGRTDETITVSKEHIVYADDKSVLTWLWNCRDAKHSSVPASTDKEIDVLVFADQAQEGAGDVDLAIKTLVEKITQINWRVIQTARLDKDTPRVVLSADSSSSAAAAAADIAPSIASLTLQ